MTKEEYIQLVKTNPEARNSALAIAWIVIKMFPALESVIKEFNENGNV